jgi:hypothetical protein
MWPTAEAKAAKSKQTRCEADHTRDDYNYAQVSWLCIAPWGVALVWEKRHREVPKSP